MNDSRDEASSPVVRRAIGLMSGTSMDGIDVAVIDTDGERVHRVGPDATTAYEPALRARLRAAVAAPDALSNAERRALAREITDAHVVAVRTFRATYRHETDGTELIGFHGHTLVHRPAARLTVQLGDAAGLATALACPVIADLRQADVRAGGEGAPLAPIYHRALARDLDQPIAVLNLGGVGNLSWLDGPALLAFDTGPGNALLDDWVERHTGERCDRDGRHAAGGTVDERVLRRLLAHPYFDATPPKSLDRNAFALQPLDDARLSLEHGAATLTAFTAASVAAACRHLPAAPVRWLVTGGGRRNPMLMQALTARLDAPVEPVEAVGWRGDALEAQAFAFLAVRSVCGLPSSFPSTTGVPVPTRGGRRFDPA